MAALATLAVFTALAASAGAAAAPPYAKNIGGGAAVGVEEIGCWWADGPWGPRRVCRDGADDYGRGFYGWGYGRRHDEGDGWRRGGWGYPGDGYGGRDDDD